VEIEYAIDVHGLMRKPAFGDEYRSSYNIHMARFRELKDADKGVMQDLCDTLFEKVM
jgi:hypothetical protein